MRNKLPRDAKIPDTENIAKRCQKMPDMIKIAKRYQEQKCQKMPMKIAKEFKLPKIDLREILDI